MGLSEALDQADEADREGFLTRLAMLLGSQSGRREFEEALAASSAVSSKARHSASKHSVVDA
jgi:3-(3-hydroxy-phenyl)propionate hydroxylase